MSSPTVQQVTPQIDLNPSQARALRDARPNDKTFHLFYGGGGSGKSFLILYILFVRAMTCPGSRHIVYRLTRNSCQTTLFDFTLREVLNVWPGLNDPRYLKIGLSDLTLEFSNGSVIIFDGLEEYRQTKVLGQGFNSIWLNECNEDGLSYRQVSTLIGRLRHKAFLPNGQQLKNKMYFDCNPRWRSDWEYRAFVLGINPLDGNALANTDAWLATKLFPRDNEAILGSDYMDLMAGNMTAADRRRYVEGDWSDDNPGALFTEARFAATRVAFPRQPHEEPQPAATLAWLAERGIDLLQVSVAADPAVTNDPRSDLHGVTVQGRTRELDPRDGVVREHAYVLADYSRQGSPDEISRVIARAYRDWGASRLVVEKNQGGLWLESTILKHHPTINLRFVSANATTGGKTSRAEPVANMYELGRVHHVGPLKELEEQMCDWGSPNSRRKSPDRMDAVVWGITDLLDLTAREQPGGGAMMSPQWFWS